MFHLLVFLLSLCHLSPVTFSETIDASKFSINDLNNDDFNSPKTQTELPSLLEAIDYPMIKTNSDETENDLNDPLASLNIDYNAIIMQLKKQRQKQQAANTNFMRFGRDKSLMRFGKRQVESMPTEQALESFAPGTRFERSNGAEGVRDSRGDNFMRFGRSGSGSKFMRLGRSPSSDFMRFGRSPSSDFMRFGRTPSDFMRFGRTPSDFMRFGRTPKDFMRFGRTPSDFMRFGRASSDFMRFGRTPSDFMRFGRTPSDFMRFGRTPSDFMRFGRTPSDFMRFGRTPSTNFMRLGRSQTGMMRSAKSEHLARSDMDKNFMRFGRPDSFLRFGRASSTNADTNPNFMRFGKRQKNETSQNSSEQNQTDKSIISAEESTTSFPYHELESDVDPIDMMFWNDLTSDSDDDK
ncbi:FMRFamide neuropeptides [Episyrphus balteatus]|uniref:FMRFamide neuropeptides n=1 Tax=Episyrphus balteatus TaxID=286459 RepID=UPI0024856454|nr:FMRFamide neuropeptides [Episyrphus balteatus]